MTLVRYKDPDNILDYEIDWSSRLVTGETISASTWTVDAGITKDSDLFGSDSVTIWLSGGTANTGYRCVNKITTSASRVREKTLIIIVRDE